MQGHVLLNKLIQYIKPHMVTLEKNFTLLQQHNNALITQVLKHVFNAQGKRLRPILTLLATGACQLPFNDKLISLAASSEIIHTATLLHDDVVDQASLRRGQASVAQQWNNKTAILVGDFLYSKAFEMLIKN